MARIDARYAAALFELSLGDGTLRDTYEQAVLLRDTLRDAECHGVLVHPHITSKEKDAFIRGAFQGRVHDRLLSLLSLLIAKNRAAYIVPVLTALIGMIDRHDRKTTASVITAAELRDGQRAALRAMLSQKLDKQVDITEKVDPSVIGGFYIQVDGYFIDQTAKKQLSDMKASLLKGCGA
ncbi:MAG: ATP synthase F1 subunit delta [Oscillospiraceae bacterium]|nr:ATP synthase F1 subunit delta [Oscillospiraceae bacterium]